MIGLTPFEKKWAWAAVSGRAAIGFHGPAPSLWPTIGVKPQLHTMAAVARALVLVAVSA